MAVAAATIVATVGLGYGQAHAAPGCTASGLSSGSELQGIASPLRSLRQSCPQQVSPGDVARALDHMLVRVREHAWTNVPSVTVAAAEVKPRRPRR
jgi:hypothetical protein